ncbi:Vps54-like protein-domain-containing protein [Obelidium mucronatum]|nr:Vps54-like protein-domain-containing protein [Obelidium mucronatum]
MEDPHSETAARYEALVDSEHVWSARDIGTNAIAGIITDPTKPNASRALKGMDALPMIPPTQMRRVKPQEFEPYEKMLEPVLDRYMINQTLGAAAIEGAPMLGSLEQQLESGSFIDLVMATERILVDNTRKNQPDRSTHRRLLAAHAPPLDTVPELFFSKDFKLGTPATFSDVYEKADFSKLSVQDVNLTSSLLQNKLGVFCDTVDVYLVKEISKRSASFFNALSTLQALHLETQSCIDQIHHLREKMRTLTENTISPGLTVSRLHTRKDNVQKLHDAVEKIFKVQSNQEVIDALIRQKAFVDALELVEESMNELKDLVGPNHTAPVAESVPENGGTSIAANTLGKAGEGKSTGLTINTSTTESTQPGSDPSSSTEAEQEAPLVQYLYNELTRKAVALGSQMETEFGDSLLAEVRDIASQINSSSNLAPSVVGTGVEGWVKNILLKKKGQPVVKVDVGRSSSEALALLDEGLLVRLTPIVFGLIRINKFGACLHQYKLLLMKEIKKLTKKNYPVPPAEISGGGVVTTSPTSPTSPMSPTSPTSKKELQTILAKQLKQMSFDSFLDLLVSIYTVLLHIFQKSSSIHAITAAIIHKAEEQGIHIGPSSSVSSSLEQLQKKKKAEDDDDDFGSGMDLFTLDPTTDALMAEKKKEEEQQRIDATGFTQLISESNEVLLAISEAANARCAKLLAVRSDQNAKLSPKDFYRLLGATREFIAASEYLCGYHCINLKGALLSQAKSFLNHFHDERTKQISIVVENEQWSRAEVPIDFQLMSEEITVAGALAIEKMKTAAQSENEDDLNDSDLAALVIAHKQAAAAASEDELVTSGRVLKVANETYSVAGCVLLLTKMLTEYLQSVDNIPSLATEILNKTLDLLKVFNSRICQVILGAGATKSAGLKNINAGHIALTAQSLGAVIGYIPHLKAAIGHHVPAKQQGLLVDFDRILKDYKEHQIALYDKLVTIMQERLSYHAKNLLSVNWDAPDNKDMTADQSCSIHMAGLIKETQTMHRVLMKFLPKAVLQNVMGQIFKAYNKGLEEELKNIELFTSAGKNRLLMDGQHLMAELSALDNVDGPGNSIEVTINNIKIRDKSREESKYSNGGDWKFNNISHWHYFIGWKAGECNDTNSCFWHQNKEFIFKVERLMNKQSTETFKKICLRKQD